MSFFGINTISFEKRFLTIVFLIVCSNFLILKGENAHKEVEYNYSDTTTYRVFQLPTDSLSNKISMPNRSHFKSSNSALRLIEEVIRQEKKFFYDKQGNYNYEVYDKLMFVWDKFNPNKKFLHHWSFPEKYVDTTIINNRSILPLAMYESFATNYYRGSSYLKDVQIVHGQNIYGIPKEIDLDDACRDVIKTLERVDIRRNNQYLFFNKIISPLNTTEATKIYRWTILDTVNIEGKPYINLCFRPSQLLDIGFMGNLYISMDGNYAVKRSVMKISRAMNINYVEEFVSYQDFEELPNKLWVPSRVSVTTKLSAFGLVKSYYEFGRTYNNFQFCKAPDSIYDSKKRIRYEKGYLERDSIYWNQKRTITSTKHNNEYRSDSIANQVLSIPFINYSLKTVNLLSNNYISLSPKGQQPKISLGTFDTFYSANSIEGSRLRLTALTSAHLFPHLFFNIYGAYGFKDEKFKYSTTATWAFNHPELYPLEFPKNNLSLSCEYDLNVLGENYVYLKRDNILFAFLHYRHLQRMTYAHRTQLAYEKEYRNGLSFTLRMKSQREVPAGDLKFTIFDPSIGYQDVSNLQTSEISTVLRYATKERFYVRSDQRKNIPDERFVVSLTHILGLNNFLGGQYHYNRLQLHLIKEYWLASFGQLNTAFKIEKVWGTLPYPLLLAPNVNNSYTIQRESFSLISPLEFINDQQMSWDINYLCKGWIMRRIPFIKKLHLREVIGINGLIGSLSQRNSPSCDNSLFVFPENTHPMKKQPYMELSLGLNNIFRIFQINYVRRLTYLDEGTKKDGLRISAHLHF